jgi:hypothetical protein
MPVTRLLRSKGMQSRVAVRGCALLATDSQKYPSADGQSVAVGAHEVLAVTLANGIFHSTSLTP